MGGTSAIEVTALFVVAVLMCWPSLRRFLPERRRRTRRTEPAISGSRFVPKPAPERSVNGADWSVAPSGRVDFVYDDEEDERDAPTPQRLAPHGPVVGNGNRHREAGRESSERSVQNGGAARETVLPLAEALLRGGSGGPPPLAQPEITEPESAKGGEDDSAAPREPFKVLLVEPRDKFRTSMLLRLARAGHRVLPVGRPPEALDVFARESSDLILIHRDALGELGVDFVQRVRATAPHAPILVHGGSSGDTTLPGELEPLARKRDLLVVAGAGDDTDALADLIECSLAASRAIRQVRDDQQVRGRILSELCYNLRASLDVISGYTEILSDEPDLSSYREVLERMRASTTAATLHMQSCVDVALDVTDSARRERVDLSTLSEKIERLVNRQIGGRPLRLTTSGPMDGSALITDGEKLLAILSHVVTDAVKFTPTGEIHITVRSLGDRTDFIVSDAGPGISADVPMPFTASPPPGGGDTASDALAGGVGLTIAERLSRSIGATLTGRCGEGGAASFTISVPGKLMVETPNGTTRTLH